jgi:hypothetical protein
MFKHAKKMALVAAALGLIATAAKADDAKTVTLGYSGYIDSNYTEDLNARNGVFNLNQFGLDINAADSAYGIKAVVSIVSMNIKEDDTLDITTINQAYAEKSFFDGMLDAKLGRFYTPVGYEVVPAYKNANETSSLLFNNEPLYHDGIILTVNPIKDLSVSGFVANDNNAENFGKTFENENEVYFDVNNNYGYTKDYGAQATYTLGSLNLTANYLYSDIAAGQTYIASSNFKGTNLEEHLINALATYKLNDSLSFGGEYLYKTDLLNFDSSYNKKDQSFKTNGYSLYTTYSLGSLSINPRFTQMFDPDTFYLVDGNGDYGFTQEEQYTLTFKYSFGSLTTYLEGNVLQASYDQAFSNGGKDPGTVGITSKVLAGASYQF